MNLSLAIQTVTALRRVDSKTEPRCSSRAVFVRTRTTGLFLAPSCRRIPVLTALEEATSFGAALTAKALVDRVSVASLKDYVKLEKKPVERANLDGLDEYVSAFLQHV